MDVAKKAMINAIELTKDTISWGLSKFNTYEGAKLLADLETPTKDVISELEDLEPGGATPLGEALQSAYNFNYNYLENHKKAAECSANFVLAVTDGFPSYDSTGTLSRQTQILALDNALLATINAPPMAMQTCGKGQTEMTTSWTMSLTGCITKQNTNTLFIQSRLDSTTQCLAT
jgi:hypothetical protein